MQIFLIAKRTTREMIWEAVLTQILDATAKVEKINTTIVTDWGGFVLLYATNGSDIEDY